MEEIESIYTQMVKVGIPEEDARYILPNACKTNIVVTMNARELRHFFSLRCCERAQWEIKQLAEMMLALVKEVAPSLFDDAGARCKQLGYCPEKRGCGRYPRKVKE
jgi:thymidylate synthase (FAD)